MTQLLEQSDARELELHLEGLRVHLRRSPRTEPMQPAPAPTPTIRAVRGEGYHEVRAPLTGIWYDSPSPGAPPYVQVGALVEVGMVIGLIETMKIFNEITADAAGVVTEIHVRRGELVAAHTPLITLQTDRAPAPGQASL